MSNKKVNLQLLNQIELINRCIERDIKAQKELYNLYSSKMMGICIRYASGIDEAKDFMQEGFIQVFNKIDTFSNKGILEGWIRKIIVNTCLMELRKARPIFNEVEDLDIQQEQVFTYMNEQDLLMFIQKLPQGFRMIFNLYAVEGYSHKEISKKLDISEGTSKSQYSRARKALQAMLEKEQRASA